MTNEINTEKIILNNLNLNKTKIEDLHNDSINFIELKDDGLIFSCSDEELVFYNMHSSAKQVLHQIDPKKEEEFSYLKYISTGNNEYLFTSNGPILNLFDINSLKKIDKFKFFKETINCIEINKTQNLIACCDDSGEIKLLDLRCTSDSNNNKKISISSPNLTLKKSLKQHTNICFTLKYNPLNEFELFSGSYDCTIIKWDTRFIKTNTNKPFADYINISETLASINKDNDPESCLVSSMTPSFVHCLNFSSLSENNYLMCGIENGLCMLFDAKTCKYVDHEQMQQFNCALTQIINFDKSDNLFNIPEISNRETIVTGGNAKLIEFMYIDQVKLDDDKSNQFIS